MTTLPNYEEQLKKLYPDARIVDERVSENLTRYKVMIGQIECSESAMREMACKYAVQDIAAGLIKVPIAMGEQLKLEL